MSPYLNIAETADLARISSKRLRNLMATGVLIEGVHFTRPRGLAARFKRDEVLNWLEGRDLSNTVDTGAAPKSHSRCRVDLSLIPQVRRTDNGV